MVTWPFILSLIALAEPAASATLPEAAVICDEAARARELLRPVAIGSRRHGLDAALVVWRPTADTGLQIVQVRNGQSVTADYEVELRRHDGDNTQYAIIAPADAVVLAVKTNYRCAERPWHFCPAVHTPYSPELETPELVDIGRTYLTDIVDEAAAELEMAVVKSSWLEDATVAEAVPSDILVAIIAVEHASPIELEADGIERVVNRFLVTLALNGEDAYRHSVSRARAVGLTQFIRSSYAFISRSYASAGLDRDFLRGTRDHLNAVKAQFCLADWSLSRLPAKQREALLTPGNDEDLGAYLAAAYNGGENRAVWSLRRFPATWEQRGRGLHRETVTYVRMFRAVYRHLYPPEPPAAEEAAAE